MFGLGHADAASSTGVRTRILETTKEATRVLGFEPPVTFEGPVDTLISEPLASELLATLREALSNVARHASASQVEISLSVAGGSCQLVIEDDGIGLDLATANASAGRGLHNMRARAQHHGGQMNIDAKADGGTVLSWQLPLPT